MHSYFLGHDLLVEYEIIEPPRDDRVIQVEKDEKISGQLKASYLFTNLCKYISTKLKPQISHDDLILSLPM